MNRVSNYVLAATLLCSTMPKTQTTKTLDITGGWPIHDGFIVMSGAATGGEGYTHDDSVVLPA